MRHLTWRCVVTAIAVISLPAAGQTVRYYDTVGEFLGAATGLEIANSIAAAQRAANAKQDAEYVITSAREQFFQGCAHGVRDARAEEQFNSALSGKDIFFLSFYLGEGMNSASQNRMEMMSRLTGGMLDGGIPSEAEVEFRIWVGAVRAALHAPLGTVWIGDSATLKAAIEQSAGSYTRYKAARDRAEFVRWRATGKVEAGPPAETPDERADRYMSAVLRPALDSALVKAREEDRPALVEAARQWTEKLRVAIIAFERVRITKEAVIEVMKEQDTNEEAIRFFSDTYDRTRFQDSRGVIEAYVQTVKFIDRQRGIRNPIEPWPDRIEATLRAQLYAKIQAQFTDLYGRDAPAGVRVTPYNMARGRIMEGKFMLPLPVPPPGADACTGKLASVLIYELDLAPGLG